MAPPLWLLAAGPLLLGAAGAIAGPKHRGRLWALGLASIPLTALLWINVAAIPRLLAEPPRGALPPGALHHALATFVLWGLGPAIAGWAILRGGSGGGDEPHREPGLLAKATLGATITLLAVAGLGLAIAWFQATGAPLALTAGLWSTVPPWLVVSLSLVAATVEETLFRGVVFRSIAPRAGFVGGALLQAVLFGLIHSGYGDPWYVIGAVAFGLVQAYVALRFGLAVAVMVHAQINLVVLGWLSRDAFAFNGWLAAAVLALNVAAILPAVVRWLDLDVEGWPIQAALPRLSVLPWRGDG